MCDTALSRHFGVPVSSRAHIVANGVMALAEVRLACLAIWACSSVKGSMTTPARRMKSQR
jgi:hypothetical protein